MAACGVSTVAVRGGSTTTCRARVPALRDTYGGVARIVRLSPATSLASRLSYGLSDRELAGNGRQACAPSSLGSARKDDIHTRLFAKGKGADVSSPNELEAFQGQGWSDAPSEEGLSVPLFLGDSVRDLRAREDFASGGDITEDSMERLVESLLREEGRSKADHRLRAILFEKIAEFFSHGRAYSDIASAAEVARAMQRIVDGILAEDGRSARDYDARAQVFAKSAEVFPFRTVEVRSK